MSPSLATADGDTVTGDPTTYHVRVGERPVTTSLTVSADRAEHTEGDTAVLTATHRAAASRRVIAGR